MPTLRLLFLLLALIAGPARAQGPVLCESAATRAAQETGPEDFPGVQTHLEAMLTRLGTLS